MTKVRKGPKCASIGLAQDALVGVRHSSTFARLAQLRMAGVLFADQVVQDDEQPVAAEPGGPDGFQCGQGVVRAFVLAGHAPQLVIGQGIAAVEVADAVRAVIGGARPGRVLTGRPAGPVTGPDRQRPELRPR